jgi:hypothetical protein
MQRFEGKSLFILPYVLILGVAALRIELANPYNLVPISSCLLFFAAMRPAREMVLPFTLMVGVDIFITTQRYSYPLTFDAVVTWAWYAIVLLMGAGVLRSSRNWRRVAGCSLLASVSFFLVSNYTVWAVWQMYPKTLAGLTACYTAALPFFRTSVTSELCFSLVLFGLASGVESLRVGSLNAVEIVQKAHCQLLNSLWV